MNARSQTLAHTVKFTVNDHEKLTFECELNATESVQVYLWGAHGHCCHGQ
mgnify:CR=1 FL=1